MFTIIRTKKLQDLLEAERKKVHEAASRVSSATIFKLEMELKAARKESGERQTRLERLARDYAAAYNAKVKLEQDILNVKEEMWVSAAKIRNGLNDIFRAVKASQSPAPVAVANPHAEPEPEPK